MVWLRNKIIFNYAFLYQGISVSQTHLVCLRYWLNRDLSRNVYKPRPLLKPIPRLLWTLQVSLPPCHRPCDSLCWLIWMTVWWRCYLQTWRLKPSLLDGTWRRDIEEWCRRDCSHRLDRGHCPPSLDMQVCLMRPKKKIPVFRVA